MQAATASFAIRYVLVPRPIARSPSPLLGLGVEQAGKRDKLFMENLDGDVWYFTYFFHQIKI
jgi:hypothetical protein